MEYVLKESHEGSCKKARVTEEAASPKYPLRITRVPHLEALRLLVADSRVCHFKGFGPSFTAPVPASLIADLLDADLIVFDGDDLTEDEPTTRASFTRALRACVTHAASRGRAVRLLAFKIPTYERELIQSWSALDVPSLLSGEPAAVLHYFLVPPESFAFASDGSCNASRFFDPTDAVRWLAASRLKDSDAPACRSLPGCGGAAGCALSCAQRFHLSSLAPCASATPPCCCQAPLLRPAQHVYVGLGVAAVQLVRDAGATSIRVAAWGGRFVVASEFAQHTILWGASVKWRLWHASRKNPGTGETERCALEGVSHSALEHVLSE